jgi:hypothetical protein
MDQKILNNLKQQLQEEEKTSYIMNGRQLRRISEEVYKSSTMLDHNRIVLQPVMQHDISDEDIQKSEGDSQVLQLQKAEKMAVASQIGTNRRLSLDDEQIQPIVEEF